MSGNNGSFHALAAVMSQHNDMLNLEILNCLSQRSMSERLIDKNSDRPSEICTHVARSFSRYWFAILFWEMMEPSGALKILLGLILRRFANIRSP